MTSPKKEKWSQSRRITSSLILLSVTCRCRGVSGLDCNPCEGTSSGFIQIPGTECAEFAQCDGGKIAQRFSCQSGLIYDKNLNQCNWAHSATCGPDFECPTPPPTTSPTAPPTSSPTESPTFNPTESQVAEDEVVTEEGNQSTGSSPMAPQPQKSPASAPGGAVSAETAPVPAESLVPPPAQSTSLSSVRQEHQSAVWAHIAANKINIANQILSMARQTHNLSGNNVKIEEIRNYAYLDFIHALQYMTEEGYQVTLSDEFDFNGNPFLARKLFYLGDAESENGAAVGLINVAAFLSQALAESIAHGSCDETNQDTVNGYLPISNACGQFGFSYQDMKCEAGEEFMACGVDDYMQTNARPHGGVTPFYCGPTQVYPFTGTANYISGDEFSEFPVKNRNGRTDVQGCCWWGRGVIQTRGVCQYGKLNYYLGARAAEEGRPTRYSNIDFCATPQHICSVEDREMEWVTGLFRWIDTVQSYDAPGWNYIQRLRQFVAGGMTDGFFIHGVSGIVSQGCHETPCGDLSSGGVELEDGHVRWAYFQQVAKALGLPVKSTS